jgi:two-component system NtrC family sensor kinase
MVAAAEHEVLHHASVLARLQSRSFEGIERRARAFALHAELKFADRASCERSGKWKRDRLRRGGYGWTTAPGDRASVWVPAGADIEAAHRELEVLAHVEDVMLAEPGREGMTQWYVISKHGPAVLVPPFDPPPDEPGFDPSQSEIFFRPAAPAANPDGRVVWTEVYNDPVGKGVMISALAPIGRGPSFEGVVGIDVNVDSFGREVHSTGQPWEYAFLLDGRGGVLLVTPEGFGDFGISAPADRITRPMGWTVARIADPGLRNACSAAPSSDGTLVRADVAGRPRWIALRPLESTGWILCAVVDPAPFSGPVRAMRDTQQRLGRQSAVMIGASAAVLLLGCALLGWFLTQRVTRPLRTLAVAARAAGAGHPESVLEAGGIDEVGTLADTLRQMIRDRDAAQKGAAEARKLAALGGMASGICHELNNLLAPILGFSQVLARDPLTPAQRAHADRVERAARSAREVVGSLLDSTREIAGPRAPARLNEVAKEALSLLESAATAADVRIVWDLDPALPRTMANVELMQRVFYNLADNAIYAMKEPQAGSRILAVRSRIENDRLVFVFEDTGPGIPSEHVSRLFDPFFTTKPPGSGTGLGLSVAMSCVRSHNGTLAAENRPGGGARFTVSIPRVAPGTPSEPPRSVPPPAPPPARRKPHVLVVDDEESIRILAQHALQDEFDVTVCESGKEALARLAAGTFEAVLCDLRLRDITGRDVFAWIRQHRASLASRFLVVTGDTHGQETQDFLSEFGTPCLTKPFDLDDLKKRVKELAGVEV